MIYILGLIVFTLISYVLSAVKYYSHQLALIRKDIHELNLSITAQTDELNYMTLDIANFKEDLSQDTLNKISDEVDDRLKAILIEKDRLETRHAELLQKYNALQNETSLKDFMDSVSGEAKILPLPEPLLLGVNKSNEDGE